MQDGGGFYAGDLKVLGAVEAGSFKALGSPDLAADFVLKGLARYHALLTQASTSAPVATALLPDEFIAITWARTSAGIYTATSDGAFASGRTSVLITGDTATPWVILTANRTSDTVVTVKAWDTSGTPALGDGLMTDATILITISPAA